jgi:hypothetical protein
VNTSLRSTRSSPSAWARTGPGWAAWPLVRRADHGVAVIAHDGSTQTVVGMTLINTPQPSAQRIPRAPNASDARGIPAINPSPRWSRAQR